MIKFLRQHYLFIKDCEATNLDFRTQQCSEFNDQIIRGQVYEWEPYVKGIILQ